MSPDPSSADRSEKPFGGRRLLLFLVVALFAAGNYQPSTSVEQRAEQLLGMPCTAWTPSSLNAVTWREAYAARQAGDFAVAIAHELNQVSGSCRSARAWTSLAELYMEAGQLKDAVRVFEHSLDLDVDWVLRDLLDGWHDLDFEPLLTSSEYLNSELRNRVEVLTAPSRKRRTEARSRLAQASTSELPPDPFVKQRSCPGEHCGFGHWEVSTDTPLVEAREGEQIVGYARKGTTVLALTGEQVIRQPEAVLVVYPVEVSLEPGSGRETRLEISVGEILFLLDYWAEGWAGGWYQGKYIGVPKFGSVRGTCTVPRDRCWGESLEDPKDQGTSEWWFQVRLDDGTEGWSKESENFLTLSDVYQDSVENPEKYQ